MSKPLIVANWKVNPLTVKEAILLAQKSERAARNFRRVEIVVAPPFLFLFPISKVLRSAKLAAQNVFWANAGPYTGEVSPRQLKSSGAKYVIIGHSERKINLGETDEVINKKVRAALVSGLKVILCVGERERSDDEIPWVVGEQLKNALKGVKKSLIKNLIVAYEPIWSISTVPGSRPDTPDNAFRVMVYLRRNLLKLYGRNIAASVPIIYGGSVRARNIGSFLREGKMEGALVGGASLEPEEFRKIVKIAASS